MEIARVAGYISSLFIGVSLGLTGGGGSILTVPILVYLFGFNPVLSTAYSLFVVGNTSLIGSLTFIKKGLVTYSAVFVYGIPSFITVFLTRHYLVAAIPDPLLHWGDLTISKDIGIMVFFAIIMLGASISMIRTIGKNNDDDDTEKHQFNYPLLALQGAIVGVVTGIVGAGGGFLIVPALVLLARLPMKVAIGTSLLIIAFNSLIGFLGDMGQQVIDWNFLLIFTALSVIGIFIGSFLSKKIAGEKLKKGFGWFILVMGLIIILNELYL